MIFNSLIKPKATLTTLPETATLDEALTVLEATAVYQFWISRERFFGEIFTKCTFTGTSHEMEICSYR